MAQPFITHPLWLLMAAVTLFLLLTGIDPANPTTIYRYTYRPTYLGLILSSIGLLGLGFLVSWEFRNSLTPTAPSG